jgi:hypothetical protein
MPKFKVGSDQSPKVTKVNGLKSKELKNKPSKLDAKPKPMLRVAAVEELLRKVILSVPQY